MVEKGLFVEAEKHSRAALRLNPALAEAHSNLGIALQHQGRRQEALDNYRDSLRLAPTLAETHLNLGRLLEELNKLLKLDKLLSRRFKVKWHLLLEKPEHYQDKHKC